jgi:hypothetical protein
MLKEASAGAPGQPLPHADELLEVYEALLHAFMHHMEECLGILKCVTPDDETFKNHKKVSAYQESVREYRAHIGKVVNRIKHQQARLRLLTVRLGEMAFGGYFVERGLEGGAVGPDPDIHKGGLTAFSFNRDLRYHLCNVILTSEQQRLAIEGISGMTSQRTGVEVRPQALSDGVWQVASLGETYFPDEYEKPRPILMFEQSSPEGFWLVVGLTRVAGWQPFAGRTFQVSLHLCGDGATRVWKLPYSPGPRGA